jgi:hypothetical protein
MPSGIGRGMVVMVALVIFMGWDGDLSDSLRLMGWWLLVICEKGMGRHGVSGGIP